VIIHAFAEALPPERAGSVRTVLKEMLVRTLDTP
jgi:hypothetical protein